MKTTYDGAGRKRIPIHIATVSPRLRRKVEALGKSREEGCDVRCAGLTATRPALHACAIRCSLSIACVFGVYARTYNVQ